MNMPALDALSQTASAPKDDADDARSSTIKKKGLEIGRAHV